MSSSSSISALKTALESRGVRSLPPDSLLEAVLSIENGSIHRATNTILDDLMASGVQLGPTTSSSSTTTTTTSNPNTLRSITSANGRRRINGMANEGLGSGSSSSRPGNGAGLNPHSYFLNNPIIYLLSLPFSLATSLISFLLRLIGLRSLLPYLGLSPDSSSRRRIRPIFSNPTDSSQKWIQTLESQVNGKCNPSSHPVSSGNEEGSSSGESTQYDRIKLPPFEVCSYKQAVEAAKNQERGQILVVVLTSEEHDDVEEFKKNTLTYEPLVELLSNGQFICWGGDVKDQEAWDVSNLLQASTYPFIAFISLRPTPSTPSSSSSSSSQLSILSRHEGSSQSSGPTSPTTLQTHLSTILLPRVSPFLNRLKQAALIRLEERKLKIQQDEAYERASRMDSDRILKSRENNRIREAEERRERESLELEEVKRKSRNEDRRKKIQEKKSWRRLARRDLGEDMRDEMVRSSDRNDYSDLSFTLPSGRRISRVFRKEDELERVFKFVDVEASTSSTTTITSDSENSERAFGNEEEEHHQILYKPHEYSFTLLTGYPRVRISITDPDFSGKKIGQVKGLVPKAMLLVEGKIDEVGWEEEEESEDED